MIVLREPAFAKINLYLHVLGKREDGYHELDSLVAFASVADILEAAPSDALTLSVEGPYASELASVENSVLRAARLLQAHADITSGAALTLHKHLPLASGIGGGSADAAAALRLLMRFWNINLPPGELMPMALKLGADVPVCLASRSLYMSGIGELLEAGPSLTGLSVLLVNPGIPLKTPDVFARFKGPFSTSPRHPREFASVTAAADFLNHHRNDLEAPATMLLPSLTSVLEMIAGQRDCLVSRMSGSGATCFGLYADAQAAKDAAQAISAAYPGWWVKSGALQ